MGLAAPDTDEEKRVAKLIDQAYDAGFDEAAAKIERLQAALEKVIAWLERLAAQSADQERRNRGRFDSLADACAADAKNYRATAADLRKVLADEQSKDPTP